MSFPPVGNDITRSLAGRLDISFDDAEAIKRHFGIGRGTSTPDDARAVAATYDSVNELLASLRNTISYFVNTRPSEPVSNVLLVGGASRLVGLREALADYTRLPVDFGSAFNGSALARSIREQDIAERGDTIAVAYGLAVGSRAA